MKDTTIEARLAELESRLAFQDITIEELNQTVTAHELEMAKLRDHMRLLTEKLKATQPSNIASKSRFFIFRSTESVATAAAVTATTFTVAVVMTMVVAVTTTAAVVAVIVVMVVTVRTVNVAMSQLFFSRFTDRNNFYVELQVLTRQHVVAVNHNVVVFAPTATSNLSPTSWPSSAVSRPEIREP